MGILRENCLRRPLHNNIMITKVGEEGAFTSTASKLLRASHNNYLIAKHEGYHMFTPLRTRGVERDLLPERFTLPELTN